MACLTGATAKELAVERMELLTTMFGRAPLERSFGREAGTGQDATIILVPKGGSRNQKLALVRLHSQVLSTHSKYFSTCLSERWNASASPSESMEFVLEVQTDVQYYFDCFSNMYAPFAKTFGSVVYGVELLKVASQIGFEGLMERISLYLSTMLWTKEEEIRVREYGASPDFPGANLEDLVSRLGLDMSEEDRRNHLGDLIREYTRAALRAATSKGLLLPSFLQGIGSGPPSDFSAWILTIVSQEALDMFISIGNEWNGKTHENSTSMIRSPSTSWRIQAMCWILETLLTRQVAEELVQAIVHLDAIPNYVVRMTDSGSLAERQKFAELVLVMFKDVAGGRLLLRPPERLALLANWHAMMKKCLKEGNSEQATLNLFLTLPLKQQTNLIKSGAANAYDFIRTLPLLSLLQSHGGLGQPENSSDLN